MDRKPMHYMREKMVAVVSNDTLWLRKQIEKHENYRSDHDYVLALRERLEYLNNMHPCPTCGGTGRVSEANKENK